MSAVQAPVARVGAGRRRLGLALLAVWGPGLIVMLADTDAGCLITAAQSGAQFGYSLILAQLALIPILYAAQEITIRLGVVTGKVTVPSSESVSAPSGRCSHLRRSSCQLSARC